jgi:hypothetical protein
MKIIFFVWLFLALCVGAQAQPRGPLPLRPAFINWKGNPSAVAQGMLEVEDATLATFLGRPPTTTAQFITQVYN